MSLPLAIAIVIITSFLLGSIPWGLVISKVMYHKDLREEGSGNIGTTNAIRTMGKIAGYGVFVLDFTKGLVSGFIALAIAGIVDPGATDAAYARDLLLAIAFASCTLGHIFTPWLGFKGGKGIAVAVGCMFVSFGPLIAILELTIFAVLIIVTRRVSVGSIASAATCPLFALWRFWGNWPSVVIASVAALVVVWAHRGNIERLVNGTESRF